MDDGSGRVTVHDLTKQFGSARPGGAPAVSGLTFSVEPGRVTGFLGPNGSGKTTTLRMILGPVAPTSGAARINGVRYAELDAPGRSAPSSTPKGSIRPAPAGRTCGCAPRRWASRTPVWTTCSGWWG